jgi:hypothetical protein
MFKDLSANETIAIADTNMRVFLSAKTIPPHGPLVSNLHANKKHLLLQIVTNAPAMK